MRRARRRAISATGIPLLLMFNRAARLAMAIILLTPEETFAALLLPREIRWAICRARYIFALPAPHRYAFTPQ